MNSPELLHSRVAECNARFPISHDAHYAANGSVTTADDLCQTAPTVLTPEAREAAIARAGAAMEAAYAHYKRTRNEDDLNRAYRHLGQMLALARMGQGARSR